jgi:hypothetical protein
MHAVSRGQQEQPTHDALSTGKEITTNVSAAALVIAVT